MLNFFLCIEITWLPPALLYIYFKWLIVNMNRSDLMIVITHAIEVYIGFTKNLGNVRIILKNVIKKLIILE